MIMMTATADLKKPVRHFLPADYVLTDWSSLEPYFQDLERRPLETREALERWLLDMSELEAVVSEDACWRQIKMTEGARSRPGTPRAAPEINALAHKTCWLRGPPGPRVHIICEMRRAARRFPSASDAAVTPPTFAPT